MSEANSYQVGGSHYRDIPGEQHWDRAVRLQLDFFQYMITKYIERAWLKNGTQDIEKALHFTQKYLECSRASGRKGANEKPSVELTGREVDALTDVAEAATRAAAVIDYVMGNMIMTESGEYTLPSGEKYTCVKGKPTDFWYEGTFGNGRTLWTCSVCRNKVTVERDVLPQTQHQCIGYKNTSGQAADGQQDWICKTCDQRCVPQVCLSTACPHVGGVVNPLHLYDKEGRDKHLFGPQAPAAPVSADVPPKPNPIAPAAAVSAVTT